MHPAIPPGTRSLLAVGSRVDGGFMGLHQRPVRVVGIDHVRPLWRRPASFRYVSS